MLIEYNKNCFLNTDNIATMEVSTNGGIFLNINGHNLNINYLPEIPMFMGELQAKANGLMVQAMILVIKEYMDFSKTIEHKGLSVEDFTTLAQKKVEPLVKALEKELQEQEENQEDDE